MPEQRADVCCRACVQLKTFRQRCTSRFISGWAAVSHMPMPSHRMTSQCGAPCDGHRYTLCLCSVTTSSDALKVTELDLQWFERMGRLDCWGASFGARIVPIGLRWKSGVGGQAFLKMALGRCPREI